MIANNNNTNNTHEISIVSWPALLSCFIAVAGIVLIARAAYGLGDTMDRQDARYRHNMILLCSGFVTISCAVAVNKFIE